MSVEVFDSTGANDAAENMFAESLNRDAINMDARRRLENKIEELRLQRELRDFDFDI